VAHSAGAGSAFAQRPLQDGALKIVARGDRAGDGVEFMVDNLSLDI
jgi:hypothetical protein